MALCSAVKEPSSVLLPLLLLLLLARCSSPLPSMHPLHRVVDRVNERGAFIGLVMAYSAEADALRSSGVFAPRSDVPYVDLYGITVQVLLDVFHIWGLVHYGVAGSANDSLSFGDVSIPQYVAFTGSWTWTKFHSLKESSPELIFGEYNIPTEGENLLSRIQFKPEELYSAGKPMEEVFWLEINTIWFQVAKQIKVELQKCVNETYCLPNAPQVVLGLKASTADVFLDNAAYREFLFNQFNVSTVDEESAAVVMTAMSPGIPVVVFRGVSDLAGGESKWSSTFLGDIASANALMVAVEFIGEIGKQRKVT